MASSIFSTYSTGENRVTASILAVLKSLSLPRVERLLGALLEQPEFELVRFENQIAKGAGSVPDGLITANFGVLIETKIKRGAVREDQVRNHLLKLEDRKELKRVLLVVTPDEKRPAAISAVGDDRVVWASFLAFDQAIEELLADKSEVVSEREAFLLRELQLMMSAERLVGSESDVVVVPVRHAWPEYERFHAYVCQPNRAFQPVRRIAFYTGGEILQIVPLILEVHDAVPFEVGVRPGALGNLVAEMLKDPARTHKESHESYKVFLLTSPNDPRTIRLSNPIQNDLQSQSGKPSAFTQNQRYVSLERLKKARTTIDLIDQQ